MLVRDSMWNEERVGVVVVLNHICVFPAPLQLFFITTLYNYILDPCANKNTQQTQFCTRKFCVMFFIKDPSGFLQCFL